MPILKNAKKALRVSKRKAALNQPIRSRVKTKIDAAKKAPKTETLAQAFSAIDKAVKKHLLHKKKAARLKSQIARLIVTRTEVADVKRKPSSVKRKSK